MRAVRAEEADPPLRVAKADQVFAEKSGLHRGTIGAREFLREECRNPIPPHQLTHRRARTNASQNFIFLVRNHSPSPWLLKDNRTRDSKPRRPDAMGSSNRGTSLPAESRPGRQISRRHISFRSSGP